MTHPLAEALAAYEANPYDPDTAEAVWEHNNTLRQERGADPQAAALVATVELALDEDGFRFIPAARVLAAAVFAA